MKLVSIDAEKTSKRRAVRCSKCLTKLTVLRLYLKIHWSAYPLHLCAGCLLEMLKQLIDRRKQEQ